MSLWTYLLYNQLSLTNLQKNASFLAGILTLSNKAIAYFAASFSFCAAITSSATFLGQGK